MDDDRVLAHGRDDDVVITITAIGQQHDHRLAIAHPCAERGERTADARGPPPARFDRRPQHVVGDAAGSTIHQWRELLRVGVRIAPIAEHHRRRGAAAQGVGLREVRHVERQ
jgi:hypothetical protein